MFKVWVINALAAANCDGRGSKISVQSLHFLFPKSFCRLKRRRMQRRMLLCILPSRRGSCFFAILIFGWLLSFAFVHSVLQGWQKDAREESEENLWEKNFRGEQRVHDNIQAICSIKKSNIFDVLVSSPWAGGGNWKVLAFPAHQTDEGMECLSMPWISHNLQSGAAVFVFGCVYSIQSDGFCLPDAASWPYSTWPCHHRVSSEVCNS